MHTNPEEETLYGSLREVRRSITPGRVFAMIVFWLLAGLYIYILPDMPPPGRPF